MLRFRVCPKAYKFIGFGGIHGPKPYKFIWFGGIHGPKSHAQHMFSSAYRPVHRLRRREREAQHNRVTGTLGPPRPLGAPGSTKPCKFIGFGAMDATKPYKIIGFGAMDATKPYKIYRVWGHGCHEGWTRHAQHMFSIPSSNQTQKQKL